MAKHTYEASEAKNNFGELIDIVQRHPVTIRRHGRDVAHVISPEDMEAIEDYYLGAKAAEIMRTQASLGPEESELFLKSILDAED